MQIINLAGLAGQITGFLDAGPVEQGCATDDAMDIVPLLDEKLRQIGAVLTCDAGD